jgi:hypothetical protein
MMFKSHDPDCRSRYTFYAFQVTMVAMLDSPDRAISPPLSIRRVKSTSLSTKLSKLADDLVEQVYNYRDRDQKAQL